MFKSLQFAAAQASRKVATPILNAQRGNATKTLYIGNIPYTTRTTELHDMFAKYGPIRELRYPTDDLGRFKGFAFIELNSDKAEEAFINLSGKPVDGDKLLKVQYAKENESSSPKEE